MMTEAEPSTRRLDGQVAIVTGAGSGIGRAEALSLAKLGARIVVNDIGIHHADSAQWVANKIHSLGGIAVANTDTVATMEGGRNIVQTALDHFGRLDILINNAGLGRRAPVTEMSEEDWDLTVAVNLKGCFTTVRHAAPVFREQRSGVIINTSSDAGLGIHSLSNYAAAKEGVIGFTRAIAWELGRYGVRCNAIRPRSFVAAEKHAYFKAFESRYGMPIVGNHPFGQMIHPAAEEVGAIVAWLCTIDAPGLNGRTLQVGGGEAGLWDEPKVGPMLFNPEGWDVEGLSEAGKDLFAGLQDRRSQLPEEAWAMIAERPGKSAN